MVSKSAFDLRSYLFFISLFCFVFLFVYQNKGDDTTPWIGDMQNEISAAAANNQKSYQKVAGVESVVERSSDRFANLEAMPRDR